MIETIQSTSRLSDQLVERIRGEGPLTFYEWMKTALYDPDGGYYCRADVKKWGRDGDYRTSPERSELFAATFARYFCGLYEQLGSPPDWTIVEVGAGEGHFAYGVIQTLQNSFPQIFAATRYVVDEFSRSSRSIAKTRLECFGHHVEFGTLDKTELATGIVFSNELLDAFPTHRVIVKDGKLQELYVDAASDGRFSWTPGPLSTEQLLSYFTESEIELAEGQIADVNLEIAGWIEKVSAKLRRGFHIAVDYGASNADLYLSPERYRGTLRAFHRHHLVDDVLARPGAQDLTTTVDWSYVKRAGKRAGLEVYEFKRQDKFLLDAGLLDELEISMQKCRTEFERLRLSTAAREMVLPNSMASSFQVLVQEKVS